MVRKLRSLCEDTLGNTTLIDKNLALIVVLTGFGPAMDTLVEDASHHAQRFVGWLVESLAIYLDAVQSLEKNIIAINREIAREDRTDASSLFDVGLDELRQVVERLLPAE